jgi:hypothetical protein
MMKYFRFPHCDGRFIIFSETEPTRNPDGTPLVKGTKWIVPSTGRESNFNGTDFSTDIILPNGLHIVGLKTAITANTTTTTAPAGSLGLTSHETGRGKLFVSDGSKWQYAAIS